MTSSTAGDKTATSAASDLSSICNYAFDTTPVSKERALGDSMIINTSSAAKT